MSIILDDSLISVSKENCPIVKFFIVTISFTFVSGDGDGLLAERSFGSGGWLKGSRVFSGGDGYVREAGSSNCLCKVAWINDLIWVIPADCEVCLPHAHTCGITM